MDDPSQCICTPGITIPPRSISPSTPSSSAAPQTTAGVLSIASSHVPSVVRSITSSIASSITPSCAPSITPPTVASCASSRAPSITLSWIILCVVHHTIHRAVLCANNHTISCVTYRAEWCIIHRTLLWPLIAPSRVSYIAWSMCVAPLVSTPVSEVVASGPSGLGARMANEGRMVEATS